MIKKINLSLCPCIFVYFIISCYFVLLTSIIVLRSDSGNAPKRLKQDLLLPDGLNVSNTVKSTL